MNTVNVLKFRTFYSFRFQIEYLIFVCFVALHPKSTAMVMAGQSIHLTTQENDRRNYFMIILHESMGPGPGSNSQLLDLQSDLHLLPDTLLTVLPGPVECLLSGLKFTQCLSE